MEIYIAVGIGTLAGVVFRFFLCFVLAWLAGMFE